MASSSLYKAPHQTPPRPHATLSHSSASTTHRARKDHQSAEAARLRLLRPSFGRRPLLLEEAAASFTVEEVEMADVDSCLKATELRLGLPGTEETAAAALPTPPSTPRGKKRDGNIAAESEAAKKRDGETAPPAAKAQVVGWPPVRSYRKSCFQQQSSSSAKQSKPAAAEEKTPASPAAAAAAGGGGALFVKVSMDGAPYLRKVDLKMYKGYRELREALEAMFLCFSGGADAPAVNPSDFAVTYEDKDGDLMLVGDVPFDMFISTCKRLRIMKGAEARGLGSVKNN